MGSEKGNVCRRSVLHLWTEIVSDLIWAPEIFGPLEIWSSKNLVPKKWVPALKCLIIIFMRGPSFSEAQISWGSNFLGPTFPGAQKSQGPK